MPYPDCAGCIGGLAAFDALTTTSSHELCEAITDPIPGQGWYDDANGEIGDICAWKTTQLGGTWSSWSGLTRQILASRNLIRKESRNSKKRKVEIKVEWDDKQDRKRRTNFECLH